MAIINILYGFNNVSVFSHPHSLTQVIRKFAKQLDEWLKIALHELPENLRNIKFECNYNITSQHNVLLKNVILKQKCCMITILTMFFLFSVSRRFSQILKRQTSLNHLCQVHILFWMFFNQIHMNKQSWYGYARVGNIVDLSVPRRLGLW